MAKLLTTKQAADYLTENGFPVRPKSLEVWRCQARGPIYVKIGRRVYYRPEHLDKFLEGIPVKVIDPQFLTARRTKAHEGGIAQ